MFEEVFVGAITVLAILSMVHFYAYKQARRTSLLLFAIFYLSLASLVIAWLLYLL